MAPNLDWKAWLSLGTFVVQNGCAALIMRYAKTAAGAGGASFSSVLMIFVQEFMCKLPFCSMMYMLECGGALAARDAVLADLRARPTEWLQLMVPAILYTVQNTMLYVGYANLEAAVGMVTYQTKILFTAVFSVALLGKRLSQVQWLSLLILFVGVLCVQGIFEKLFAASASSPSSGGESKGRVLQELALEALDVGGRLLAAATATTGAGGGGGAKPHNPSGGGGSHHGAATSLETKSKGHYAQGTHTSPPPPLKSGGHHGHNRATPPSLSASSSSPPPPPEATLQNPSVGIAAFILAAVCTSFASVYFEKMLKGASKPSLWLRNCQLALYSSACCFLTVLMQPGGLSPPGGLWVGFNGFAWFSAIWQAFGGIIVAVTIKYADNILRGFAQALAIIVGSIGSYFIFGFLITPAFMLGVALVIAAVFLYGAKAQTPLDLCAGVCLPMPRPSSASGGAPSAGEFLPVKQ